MNGFYASGSGSIFKNCPLTYGQADCTTNGTAVTYSAFYLKGTAVQNATIAEYIVTFDCNLNAGKGGTAIGINDNKVCQYNSGVTGPNAGQGTWIQANNLWIKAGDNDPPGSGVIPFKHCLLTGRAGVETIAIAP